MTKKLYRFFKKKIARFVLSPDVSFGAILMLHRISIPDNDGIWYNQHLKLSPSTVKAMTEYARKLHCHFVSMAEMEEAIRKKKRVRRWIAVTLDDGYRDNFTNGVPVFRQLNIPYTIYICTRIVKDEMLYWWEILEKLVLKHDSIVLNDGRFFDCSTTASKEQSFLDLRELIMKQPHGCLLKSLKQMFENYDVDYNYGNQSLGLTWTQILDFKKEPLATIGNHSYSHNAFTNCSDEVIVDDIGLAAREMYQQTGIEMRHFAFPYGEETAVSQHDIELVKQLGFQTSATARDGLVCYGTDPMELPRIFVTERNWKQVIDRIAANC